MKLPNRLVRILAVGRRGDGTTLAAAVLGPLLLYWHTLPRNVVLEDDGLFLMAGAQLGIAHPPGYPLYTLICHLFMQLPFGGPALLGHLASATLGALACGAVYVCARLLAASSLSALAAAWLFGVCDHVWSQAIIADVYTFHALLFFAAYALILRGVREPDRRRWWVAAAAVFGLGLANHWPLLALAAAGLLAAALPALPTLVRKPWLLLALFAVGLACACLPYLGMVLRSWQAPFISFYGPIEDWPAFWHYVTRSGYAEVDSNPIASWDDRLAFLQWFGHEIAWQLTLPGFLLAVVGLALLLRRGQLSVAVSGVLAFMGNSVVLLMLLEFDFDYIHVAIFRPYSLICYGLLAVWLAIGLEFGAVRLGGLLAASKAMAGRFKAGLLVVASLGMSAFSLMAHWPANDRADYDFAASFAEMIFELLPPNAVLLVQGDLETATLGYRRFVALQRPDVDLISLQGLVYGNRLYHPTLPRRHREEITRRFVAKAERPVYTAVDNVEFPYGRGFRHYGFVKELLKESTAGSIELAFSPIAGRYFEALLTRRSKDGWEQARILALLHRYGQYLSYPLLAGDPGLVARTQRLRELAQGNFASLMGMAQVLLKHGNATHWEQVDVWLDKASSLRDSVLGDYRPAKLSKWRRAELSYLQGVLLGRRGDEEAAIAAFRDSWATYPSPSENKPALDALNLHGVAP